MEKFYDIEHSLVYKYWNDDKYAIISSYVPEEYIKDDIRKNYCKLRCDIRKLGLGYVPFVICWEYQVPGRNPILINEWYVLVRNISKRKAVELGKSVNQKSIIYKDNFWCNEIYIDDNNAHIISYSYKISTVENIKNFFIFRQFSLRERQWENFDVKLKYIIEILEPQPSYFQIKHRYRIIYSDKNLSVADALNELNKLN